jgi:hypothetical protein
MNSYSYTLGKRLPRRAWQAAGLPNDKLLYGTTEAYIQGSFHELKLKGPYKNQPWGAH